MRGLHGTYPKKVRLKQAAMMSYEKSLTLLRERNNLKKENRRLRWLLRRIVANLYKGSEMKLFSAVLDYKEFIDLTKKP